jgi:GNAT superfamily N-acetyltransferase
MPEQIDLTYRPMTVADIDATGYVRKAALEELDRSQNKRVLPWQPQRFPHFEHLLRTDPEGAWVAEAGGTVVGFSMGFTRGDIWFLAQLFVQPELHGLGAGQGTLERSIRAGRKRGARVLSVVSSTSPVSQSLYMRQGMFAIAIGYRMSGPIASLRALPDPPREWRTADPSGHGDAISELDTHAWGAPRPAEHGLYQSGAYGPEDHGFVAVSGDAVAGYGYCSSGGHIGPFAAREPAMVLSLLRIAGDWIAERGAEEGWGYFLSSNTTALGALLAGGWRIDDWTFFLTSEPYGRFDRYVPSGGLLL